MSNNKNAYGWSGHLICSSDERESHADDNLIAIAPVTFARIVEHYDAGVLDERIEVQRLGVIDSDTYFLAIGSAVSFSEGYTFYGTVFKEAEIKTGGGQLAHDHDADYLEAMREIYQLELPPCRLMIGCSSEH